MFSTIETLFLQYGAWSWWVLGLVLLGAEIFAPGFILVWFGAAAILVGVLALLVSWPIRALLLVWAVTSIALLIVGRRLVRSADARSQDPLLNDRAGRLIGRVFTLAEPLGENGGHLSIDDTLWRIRGPLTDAGTRVRIASVEGSILVVEPVA